MIKFRLKNGHGANEGWCLLVQSGDSGVWQFVRSFASKDDAQKILVALKAVGALADGMA